MTDAEKRDASLRTVELPDCCGNCRHYSLNDQLCWLERPLGKPVDTVYAFDSNFNQVCDLHERRK